MGERNAKLNIGEESQDYAILSGSVGPDVLDIRKLYANTGMFTFDPGFTSTASCESGLTYIDGDQGVLLHRGYPIEQLRSEAPTSEIQSLMCTTNAALCLKIKLISQNLSCNPVTHHTFL